jgi:Spy/CpxP family protein refolding chaperone
MGAAGGMNLKLTKYLNVALGGVLFLGMSVGAVAQSGSATMQGAPQPAPQQQAPPPMTMDQRMAQLTEVLNLTPAQQQKIRPILEDAQAKMQALSADHATPIADRQAKALALRQSIRSQIDAVLTPEQRQKAMAPHPAGPGSSAPQP